MKQFQATLIASGDPDPLPTVIELNQGNLVIQSNGQPLGNWPVTDLEFVRIVGGFRVTLDGEVAVLKLPESDEFNAELRQLNEASAEIAPAKRDKKKREKRKQARKERSMPAEPTTGSAPAETRTKAVAAADKDAAQTEKDAGQTDKGAAQTDDDRAFIKWLDAKLEVAAKRGGKYLPEWVFTRGGVVVGFLLLIALVLFHGAFSTIFLIIAAIGMITSAVALMDQVIATKIFRGAFTPIHGLLGSLVFVLVGIALGAL